MSSPIKEPSSTEPPTCQQAFEQLKNCLAAALVLNFPVPGATYILDTDASDRGIGGCAQSTRSN